MAANDIGPRIGLDGEKEFRDSLKAINAQMKALTAEMRAVAAEAESSADSEQSLAQQQDVLARAAQAAKDKMSVLRGELDRQKEKLDALAQAAQEAAEQYGEDSQAASAAQNAYNRQVQTVQRLEEQYQNARAQLAGFQNDLEDLGDTADDASDSLNGADVMAGQAAWDLLQTAVNGVKDALADAIGTAMEFDKAMSGIAATMGTTVADLGDMRDFALDMGQTTAFTATQAADALNYMALAGYDAQTAMETLPTVLDLAAAGGVELAAASDMITDAQSALGLSMEETSALVDQMAQASTKTNTSVAQLGEAILTVGGTAKFMAGGTAELTQVLGRLADNSIKGEEGGTKLRNIILSLSSPTEKAAQTLEELRVAVFDAEGDMRRFSEIFPEMQRALSSLTDQKQIEALGEIFNVRDIAAAQALLGTTTERWAELEQAIDASQGAAQRMADTRLDNLAGDLTLLQSAADGAKIALADSLTPALRDVAQAGTGILTFVGGFVKEVPLAGQVLTGLTVGLGVFSVGATAAALATTSLGKALAGAWATMAASPLAPLAVALGVAAAAFTALSYAADEAGKRTTEAAQAVDESRKNFEAVGQAAQAQRQDIEGLVSQIEALAGAEERTAGQKEQLLALTQQLNAAVPGLGLEYDQLNDTLNMTAGQLKELALAQAAAQERADTAQALIQARQAEAQTVRELEEAHNRLAAARQAVTDAEAAGMAGDLGSIETMDRLRGDVKAAQSAVTELESALTESQEQTAQMETKLDDLAQAGEETAQAMSGAGQAVEEAGGQAGAAAPALQALEESTLYAAGAADTLTDALKEQEKAGSLSYDTAQELIDAGYGTALAIDEETGAVTVNREEYVRLANAKIEEQLATLEAQKASLAAAAAMKVEQNEAYNVSSAYWEAAKAKAAQSAAGDTQALDLQIAALNRAKASLGSYGGAVTQAARRSSSASRKIKTQAEKDLAEYKDLKAELDHEKNMGLTDEADYYRRLEELRDRYLTGAGNVDEYRKVSETIYKADEKALQEREKLWQSAGDGILKLEEEFQQKLSQRAEQIVNSYKLFDAVPEYQKASGLELIANLEDQISAIQDFYGNIAALEERGVDAALVEDIRSMGVQASGELAGLLELTDEQLTRYSELYGEKQALANDLAAKELEGLRNETDAAILGQLDSVGALYDANGPALGLAFANSLAQGMFEGMPQVNEMARAVAASAMRAFESTYNRDVEALMTQGKPRVTSGDIGELLAGAVNGINMNNAGGGVTQPAHFTLVTRDNLEIARGFLPAVRTAEKEIPETLDDT